MLDALQTPTSVAEAFFGAQAYDKHRAWVESQDKLQAAIVDRQNQTIRALGILAKRS